MAATRRNRSKPEDPLFQKTRDKIKVGQLVDRLSHNALGTLKKNSGKPKDEDYVEEYIEMSVGQLRAAEILLSKSLPSLTSTTIEANVSATVTLESLSDEELEAQIKEKTIALNAK